MITYWLCSLILLVNCSWSWIFPLCWNQMINLKKIYKLILILERQFVVTLSSVMIFFTILLMETFGALELAYNKHELYCLHIICWTNLPFMFFLSLIKSFHTINFYIFFSGSACSWEWDSSLKYWFFYFFCFQNNQNY